MGCRGTAAEMGLKFLNQVVVHCFVVVLTSSMGELSGGGGAGHRRFFLRGQK